MFFYVIKAILYGLDLFLDQLNLPEEGKKLLKLLDGD